MTVFFKELKQGRKSLLIWTAAISFMLIVCVLMYPEMKNEMDDVSNMFSNMGDFTAAFGMDKLNFGDIMGFYGIECGNVLGIGGGIFAAFVGVSVLSKEEKDRTAEFLLSHPVSRASVLWQKLLSVLTQLISMNIIITIVSAVSFLAIDEKIAVKEFLLLHLSYTILQIEIASICFGISAFIKRGSIGIGIGLATIFYFMNIVCNISKQAEFLKYITPFAYSDASKIITDSKIEILLVGLGLVYSLVGILIGFAKYTKKDIAS